jgi:hypothetical protein
MVKAKSAKRTLGADSPIISSRFTGSQLSSCICKCKPESDFDIINTVGKYDESNFIERESKLVLHHWNLCHDIDKTIRRVYPNSIIYHDLQHNPQGTPSKTYNNSKPRVINILKDNGIEVE